jgi:hypothetical protein
VSRLTELEEWPSQQELIFPCDCGDGDYLRITWDDIESDWRALWIEHHQKPRGWKRFKGMWAILRGRSYIWGEVILTDESIKGLHAFLNLLPEPIPSQIGPQGGRRLQADSFQPREGT